MDPQTLDTTTPGSYAPIAPPPPPVSTAPDPGLQQAPQAAAPTQAAPTGAAGIQAGYSGQPDVSAQPGTDIAGPNEQPQGAPGVGAQMLHGILSALGGTQDVTYSRDPQTGALVQSSIPSGPGMQFKRIIAGAVQGLAASAQAGPGPGQMGRALALGAGGGFQGAQQQDQQKRQQADDDYNTQQKATVSKAQNALLTAQLTRLGFQNGRDQLMAQFDDAQRENAFVQAISAGGQGSRDLGVISKPEGGDYMHALIDAHNNDPSLVKQQAQGNIIGTPHINASGQIDGMHYAVVTPEWKAQRSDQDQSFYKLAPPTEPGQPPTVQKQTVKAGTMTNDDFWKAQNSAEQEIQKWYATDFTQKQEDKRSAATNATSLQDARIRAGAELQAAAARSGGMGTGADGDIDLSKVSPSDLHIFQGLASGALDSTKVLGRMTGAQRMYYFKGAQAVDPGFTTASAPGRQQAFKDFTAGGNANNQIISYNTFLGHELDLSDKINQLRNTNSPLLNMPLNKLRTVAEGDPSVSAVLAPMLASRTEYLNFLNGGHALHAEDVKEGTKALNENMSFAQMQAAMKGTAETAAIRARELNVQQKNAFHGKTIVPVLSPTGAAALHHFGFDNYVQELNGGGADQTQQPQQATPQTHVFSVSAWAKANPGKDANAAKAQAQQQGYQVTN